MLVTNIHETFHVYVNERGRFPLCIHLRVIWPLSHVRHTTYVLHTPKLFRSFGYDCTILNLLFSIAVILAQMTNIESIASQLFYVTKTSLLEMT